MTKHTIATLLIASLAATAACKKKEEAPKAPAKPAAGSATTPAAGSAATTPTTPAAGSAATPAAGSAAAAPAATIDFMAGQSTGAKTEDVPNAADKWRNTLVDREIGASVTCPVDRTWKCKLGADKKFDIKDMSSNTFTLRVASGTDAAAALANEIAYVTSILPGVKQASTEGTTAILDVGPDPTWATPVARKAWVSIKDVGGKLFACHGLGSESNFTNDSPDFKALCDSVVAPAS